MPTITIRGISYKTSQNVAMQSIPLFSAMGIDLSGVEPISNAAFAQTVIQKLAEPSNWHKIAYSLRAIAPGLPPEIASYSCRLFPDGSKEEVGFIDLSTEELVEVFSAIMESLPKVATEEKPVAKARRSRRAKAV